MKKSILLMLLLMIPFLMVGQKRNKKNNKDIKTEKTTFMILKGVEVSTHEIDQKEMDVESSDMALGRAIKGHISLMSEFHFSFDFGDPDSKEANEFTSSSFRSMAEAVNFAEERGWEFISSNVVIDGDLTIHYYYMRR